MSFATWHDLYASDLQSAVAVTIVPALFLIYLALTEPAPHTAAVPAATRFIRVYAWVFAIATIADPLVGGPLLRALGLGDAAVATVVMVAFVLLGDFRVYLLLFALLASAGARRQVRAADPLHAARDALRLLPPRAVVVAALWTLLVPLVAVTVDRTLRAQNPALPAPSIWLAYELAFLAVTLALRAWLVPAQVPLAAPRLRTYLRAVLAYVAVYYALWAAADVVILAGFDVGWALRMIPNQLYYACWVPFAYERFFARR